MARMSEAWPIARVMLVCALLTTVVSWPALTGDKVYDDVVVVGHELLDDLGDLRDVFLYGSDRIALHDCAATKAPPKSLSTTYRPIPVASVVPVNWLAPGAVWPHHIVSLLLHLLCCLGLLDLLSDERGRVSWLAALAVLVFALHPAQGEAYQYIDGRSDVLAGLGLVGLMLVLRRAETGGAPVAQACLAALTVAFGVLSKAPFVVAAVGVAVVWLVREPSLRTRAKRLAPTWLGIAIGLGATLALRARIAPTSSPPLLHDQTFLRSLPHAFLMGLETTFVPLARPMRALMWEVYQPWTTSQVACGLLALLLAALLIARRRWFSLGLCAVALATLAPSAYVANFFWLGFDRYLYMPLMLATVAVVHSVPIGVALRPALRYGAVGLVALLCLMAFTTAGYYADNTRFWLSMAEARPDDPSPYLLSATFVTEDRDAFHAIMAKMPPPTASPIAVREAAYMMREAGFVAQGNALVEISLAEGPRDEQAAYNELELRRIQGRVTEALALAEPLVASPIFCASARSELYEIDVAGLAPDLARRLSTLRGRDCP